MNRHKSYEMKKSIFNSVIIVSFAVIYLLSSFTLLHGRKGKDRAIFFAVKDYKDNVNFSSLNNPIKDAVAIAKELEEIYGFTTEIYRNKTKAEILEIVGNLQKQSFADEDQLFIFFSGHGAFQEVTNEGYFIPYGLKYKNFDKSISFNTLGKSVAKIPCKHTLLALDACYSGTIDTKIIYKSELLPIFEKPGYNNEKKINDVISKQLRNASKLIITSGGKEKTEDGINHSPFSEAIINTLRTAYRLDINIVLYEDVLSALAGITSSTCEYGRLNGHKGGGFVFVADISSEPKPELESKPKPEPRFPIVAVENCNKIKGKSWRCCGLATLNYNGKLVANIRTSSNRLQGFTGAVKFTFYYKNGKPVYMVQTPSYGVNGEGSRNDIFKTQVDKDMLDLIYSFKAEGIHTPSKRTEKIILEEGKNLLKTLNSN